MKKKIERIEMLMKINWELKFVKKTFEELKIEI